MPGLVLVSNRGPLSWSRAGDGSLVARRGGGGLVSGLVPLVQGTETIWIAAAMTEADREAAGQGRVEAEGLRAELLDIDPATYRMAYDVVSNATLWFLYHGLFDLGRRPLFDRHWRTAWDAYRRVNDSFAQATADLAPPGATVLVQDYHLALVADRLAERRPDLRTVHFSHTPFPEPSGLSVLPDDVSGELLAGMTAHGACGFHGRRWADAFSACCAERLGLSPVTFVAPLGPDAQDLERVAAEEATQEAARSLERQVGERRMILRVDRIEPSKNILRGLLAYDALLKGHPELVGEVVLVALVYPSRERLAEYQAYRAEVETLAADLNRVWSRGDRRAVLLETEDDFPRSVAALGRYDVLLVNPVRDGLNLVAKEGPLLNRRNGVLALSREAGSWEELSEAALEVNPFDVEGTACQLARALSMAGGERAERAATLARLARRRHPRVWLDDQLAAAV
ncbi:MAG: alpha,alpha-trehalose-phosphate synthase (UDP-forming) [Acidimicrobiales bacterium]